MNYFTPELIVRGQSQDAGVVNEVEALWDEAGDRYAAYLASVRAEMPAGLLRRVDGYYLHDALVRAIGQEGPSFAIVVQLDTPPHSLVTFTYDLLAPPSLEGGALPPELRARGDRVEWMYDELERAPGSPPSWAQSILLSNGWEVKLHFRDVQVREARALFPAPRNGTPAALTVSQPA